MIDVIDTHVHFWDLRKFRYPWLESPEWGHLSDPFGPGDIRTDSANVLATVHVQAEMDHDRDPVDETRWMDSLRNDPFLPRPTPTVCVGYADLTDARITEVLDRHQEFDFFRGIRQQARYDPNLSGPEQAQVDLVNDPRWQHGLRELERRGLAFDLLVFAQQLREAAEVFAKLPDLNVVINHLGLPTSAVDRATWRSDLEYFRSQVPRAHIKISGLAFISHDLADVAIRNYVSDAIEVFGPSRAMVASDFPVDKDAGTYNDIWEIMEVLTRGLSADERAQLLWRTGASFYRITVDEPAA